MIYFIGIIVFASGFYCGIWVTQWAYKQKLSSMLQLRNREKKHDEDLR
jgi:hypothetical protein